VIKLENQLEALLIHDPDKEQVSSALDRKKSSSAVF
jgi:secreted Zn-dependent insulinase-like peptidase